MDLRTVAVALGILIVGVIISVFVTSYEYGFFQIGGWKPLAPGAASSSMVVLAYVVIIGVLASLVYLVIKKFKG